MFYHLLPSQTEKIKNTQKQEKGVKPHLGATLKCWFTSTEISDIQIVQNKFFGALWYKIDISYYYFLHFLFFFSVCDGKRC